MIGYRRDRGEGGRKKELTTEEEESTEKKEKGPRADLCHHASHSYCKIIISAYTIHFFYSNKYSCGTKNLTTYILELKVGKCAYCFVANS